MNVSEFECDSINAWSGYVYCVRMWCVMCEAQSCLHSRTLKPRSLLIPVVIMYMKFCNVYLQTSILGLVYLNFLHVHTCTYSAKTRNTV